LALLREEEAAAGRLWLGRVTAALTEPDSPPYLCSPRHLRRLLKRGNGRFWTLQEEESGAWRRVWLRSQARVADALGVARVAARPVALPLDVLLGPIGDVRAHFYASFHSSRGEEAGPISRAALAGMSGASPRAQQAYEKRAGVEAEAQFAVGDGETAVSRQETAWQRGRAAFTLVDVRGQQGRPGRRYVAWRLPNRYRGPRCHRRLPAGRRRRLRRQLAGLRTHGGAGNGRMGARRYFSHVRAAVRARGNGRDRYWPLRRPGYLGRRMVGIWLVWAE
jgi:hypothetical protein